MSALRHGVLVLFVAAVIGCEAPTGSAGATGPKGPTGPTGPSVPVIASIVTSPPEIFRGDQMTLSAYAMSPSGATLTYTWTLPPGFTVVSGAGTSFVVVTANQFAAGVAEVAVSDGTLSATAGVYVGTVDGAWQLPLLTETGDNVDSAPAVGIDDAGEALVAFTHWEGGVATIRANVLYASGRGIPVDVSAAGLNNAVFPDLEMNGGGKAVAVWTQKTASADGFTTYASVFTGSTFGTSSWGTATKIGNTGTGYGDASNPRVAINGGGAAVAVWYQHETTYGKYHVWANWYVPGTGWNATPVQMDQGNALIASGPYVAIDSSGEALIVWTQEIDTAGGPRKIVAKRLSAGTPSAAVDVATGADDHGPQIAMDAAGNAAVVWQRIVPGHWHVYGSRYSAGMAWGASAWTAPTLVINDRVLQRVDMNGAGDVIVGTAAGGGVWASLLPAGAAWDTGWSSTTLNVGAFADTSHERGLKVGIDDAGNAIALWWQRWSDGLDHVFACRYRPESGWGHSEHVEGAEMANDPDFAMNVSGTAVAAWREYQLPGTIQHVAGARFE